MPTAAKPYRPPGYKPRAPWAHSGEDRRKGFRGRNRRAAKIRVGERDEWTCRKCGKGPLTERETILDHIIPLCEGGNHEDTNLQTLCIKCSNHKTAQEAAKNKKVAPQRGGGQKV